MNVFQYIEIDIVIAKWRLKYWSQNGFSDCNSMDLNGNGYCKNGFTNIQINTTFVNSTKINWYWYWYCRIYCNFNNLKTGIVLLGCKFLKQYWYWWMEAMTFKLKMILQNRNRYIWIIVWYCMMEIQVWNQNLYCKMDWEKLILKQIK